MDQMTDQPSNDNDSSDYALSDPSGAAAVPNGSVSNGSGPIDTVVAEPEPIQAQPIGAGGGNSGFVVVANRLPVDLEKLPDGGTRWKRSPGGLVTALEPVLRSNKGAWVGWAGVPDVDVDPIIEDGLELHPVPLSAQEVEDYYEGFSNGTLWPLYHDVIVRPVYDRKWWAAYVQVNRRFAEATAKVAAEGATVWVQDYQLQLVPKMLRMLRPDLTIGFFLHIPFPPVELFMQMPWRTEIIEGLLGADLIGFHLPGGAQNFLYLARRLAGQPTSRGTVGVRSKLGVVQVGFRNVRVGAFPISIASAELDEHSRRRSVRERAAKIRAELGNPKNILLGVDRLDYTKGIDIRLNALEELLMEGRVDPSDTVMVQLATPSRERVQSYIKMRGDIERQVGRINGEFARVGYPVVHYLHRPIPREELIAFFVAADAMLVTPLRDGMNLVAKEYVACHSGLNGALVLSEFTGAAAELRQSYLCNPHDLDSVKDAIASALTDDRDTKRRRMRSLRRQVLTHDVDRWARAFLDALAHDQVAGSALLSEEDMYSEPQR
ncbi:putative trehalose-6-phosphate synthase [Nocardia cyriacigeorgica GUH-2]|uniref:alpha,alpha-trehalose-phosphate synthase (ADP-forming) n=2 Tax=Nocardia TaxID=1817 RepID=H6RCT0_NOCCG|nr:putative trehalose-6-phosphate synthase [Nocardia cyriacigeorgica GUH-2]